MTRVNRLLVAASIVCFAGALCAVLGAFWWWALVGLDARVGTAWGVTATVLCVVGSVAAAASSEYK